MNKMMLKKQYMMYAPKKKGRLPSDYQEVEYIESTGTQYIDTLHKPTNNTKIEFDITLTAYDGFIFGSWNAWQESMYTIYNLNGEASAIGYGANWVGNLTGIKKDIRTTFSIDNGVVKFGSTTKGTFSDVFTSNRTLTLSATHTPNGVEAFAKLKIHYCSLYDNGTIIREFIPCYRKSDNEVGLYDIVNNQFYTNSGSGTFLMGRPLVYDTISGYQQVDYIESTGTQYFEISKTINTPIRLNCIVSPSQSQNAKIFVIHYLNDFTNNYIPLGTNTSNEIWYAYTNSNWNGGSSLANNTKQTLSCDFANGSQTIKKDGISIFTSSYTGNITANQIWLFYEKNADNISSYYKGKLYYFKIDGVLELIPCYRKCDNEIGLYDLVGNQFYTNQGSGEFIAGEVLKA